MAKKVKEEKYVHIWEKLLNFTYSFVFRYKEEKTFPVINFCTF